MTFKHAIFFDNRITGHVVFMQVLEEYYYLFNVDNVFPLSIVYKSLNHLSTTFQNLNAYSYYCLDNY